MYLNDITVRIYVDMVLKSQFSFVCLVDSFGTR
jgi:hypothetical protein